MDVEITYLKTGAVKVVPSRYADILAKLGLVKIAAASTPESPEIHIAAKKRSYRRRDIRAE